MEYPRTLFALAFAFFLIIGLGVPLQRYSLNFVLPHSMLRLHLSVNDAIKIIRNHSIVLIGGPHRGGTTILWELISLHRSVSAFGSNIPADFSEGSFLQSVLPTYGVGNEESACFRHRRGVSTAGLGRYALSPYAHQTENSPLNREDVRTLLVSEWGRYWDLERPVLLEKTPTNMVSARLLQALFAPSASFLFISRHPLAVELAERRMSRCRRTDRFGLGSLNWVAAHSILQADLPSLASARVIRYEDLVRSPWSCMSKVADWLGLEGAYGHAAQTSGRLPDADFRRSVLRAAVSNRTNAKYEAEYCGSRLATAARRARHCALGAALQPHVTALGLGYDLLQGGDLGFACIRQRIAAKLVPSAPSNPAVVDCGGQRVEAEQAIADMLQLRTGYRGQPQTHGVDVLGGNRLLCARM
eukprot:CAMPEP_0183338706 /NCGR_PEP_ID=MMETSP0164_2-20130417/5901_1 /TAXON_ID=221442 /ORGANISM="Coccolithus pelagicus ssp braarudi, Strain PLY182g" /LENGTH=414 /DNA_ID=CAMNT_0025508593 /DNA_START=73 /DNA_END=1317 /DNA_ORIENTATION=-